MVSYHTFALTTAHDACASWRIYRNQPAQVLHLASSFQLLGHKYPECHRNILCSWRLWEEWPLTLCNWLSMIDTVFLSAQSVWNHIWEPGDFEWLDSSSWKFKQRNWLNDCLNYDRWRVQARMRWWWCYCPKWVIWQVCIWYMFWYQSVHVTLISGEPRPSVRPSEDAYCIDIFNPQHLWNVYSMEDKFIFCTYHTKTWPAQLRLACIMSCVATCMYGHYTRPPQLTFSVIHTYACNARFTIIFSMFSAPAI